MLKRLNPERFPVDQMIASDRVALLERRGPSVMSEGRDGANTHQREP